MEYTGERTPEAAFHSVINPVAQEHGIEITFQDYQASIESNKLSLDEMEQVSGGEGDRDWEKNCKVVGVAPGFDWDDLPVF